MEILSQGPGFARNLGKEFLTWAFCCGELKYAIRSLSLPSDPEIISKLIHCIKFSSISENENRKKPEYNLTLVLYTTNCFETLRILAEKNEIRSLELFQLVIELMGVRDNEMQAAAFNFSSFSLNNDEMNSLWKSSMNPKKTELNIFKSMNL